MPAVHPQAPRRRGAQAPAHPRSRQKVLTRDGAAASLENIARRSGFTLNAKPQAVLGPLAPPNGAKILIAHDVMTGAGEGSTLSLTATLADGINLGIRSSSDNWRFRTRRALRAIRASQFFFMVAANARNATHVLDGLLYQESDLRIEEHHTDTAGFTDNVCALPSVGLSLRSCIRDLADKRLYVQGKERDHSALAPLIGGKLNLKLVRTQWEEILPLASPIRHESVTASLITRKLAGCSPQNSFRIALREVGRIQRSVLCWNG